MSQVKATPIDGRRVRKENGVLLKAEGEPVERNAYWIRRKNDGDVTLEAIAASSVGVADAAASAAKPKK